MWNKFEANLKRIKNVYETKFQPNVKRIWNEFETNVTQIWSEFEMNFNGMWNEFEANLKWIKNEFEANFNRMRNEFEANLKWIKKEFEANFNRMWNEFEANLKRIWKEFQPNVKWISSEFEKNWNQASDLKLIYTIMCYVKRTDARSFVISASFLFSGNEIYWSEIWRRSQLQWQKYLCAKLFEGNSHSASCRNIFEKVIWILIIRFSNVAIKKLIQFYYNKS